MYVEWNWKIKIDVMWFILFLFLWLVRSRASWQGDMLPGLGWVRRGPTVHWASPIRGFLTTLRRIAVCCGLQSSVLHGSAAVMDHGPGSKHQDTNCRGPPAQGRAVEVDISTFESRFCVPWHYVPCMYHLYHTTKILTKSRIKQIYFRYPNNKNKIKTWS